MRFFLKLLAGFFFCSSAVFAQSFEGIELGGKIDTLQKLGEPAGQKTDLQGNQYKQYLLSDGNALSVTINPNGEIVLLEKDWESGKTDQKAGFDSFVFGQTTIMDTLIALGHSGRVDSANFPMQTMENGDVAYIMPYDLEDNAGVVIFIFLLKETDFLLIDPTSADFSQQVSQVAKLDSIIIVTVPVFETIWQSKFIEKTGKPIQWLSPD